MNKKTDSISNRTVFNEDPKSTPKGIKWFGFRIKNLKRKHFLLISLVILALPVLKEWNTLAFGERVDGVVLGTKKIMRGRNSFERGVEFRSVIEYTYKDSIYNIKGPENLNYEAGRIIPLIIKKGNPHKVIIATFVGFYVQKRSIALIIVFLVWTAIFSTLLQYQKGQIKEK